MATRSPPQGLSQIAPPPALQARVMAAIYGERGVKAGFTDGACRDDIEAALDGLVRMGARVVLLGCTELPLLLPAGERSGAGVTLVDPTDVLASACIAAAGRAPVTQDDEADRR